MALKVDEDGFPKHNYPKVAPNPLPAQIVLMSPVVAFIAYAWWSTKKEEEKKNFQPLEENSKPTGSA